MTSRDSQPRSIVVSATTGRIFCLALSFLAVMLTGCVAAEKSYHFNSHSVTQIDYDPKHCMELPSGKYKCDRVIFTVGSIEPDKK